MSNSLEIGGQNLQPELNYEPPLVESVLTPEKLEREVLYAGSISQHKDHDTNPEVFGFVLPVADVIT